MTQKYTPTKWVARETVGTAEVMNNIEQGIVGAYDEIERVDSQLAHNTNYLDNKKLDKNGIVTMANMGQDVKEAMTGGSVAVVGDNTILNSNIVAGQINSRVLSDAFDYISTLGVEDDILDVSKSGMYICIGKPKNSPPMFNRASYFLEVKNFNTYIVYNAYLFGGVARRVTCSRSADGTQVIAWKPTGSNNMGQLNANTDLNTVIDEGYYLTQTGGQVINGPVALNNKTCIMHVYVAGPAINYNFIIQEYHEFDKPNVKYVRSINSSNNKISNWEVFKTVESLNSIENVVSGGDLNSVTEPGTYVVTNSPTNMPYNSSSGLLTVEKFNNGWRVQKIHRIDNVNEIYVRIMQYSSGAWIARDWTNYKSETELFPLINTIDSGSLDNVTKRGSYIYINNPNENPLTSSSGSLEVDVYNNRWVVQRVMHLKNQNEIYMRVIDTDSKHYYKSPWQSLVPPSNISKLSGKTIVNFGDSIFGNTRGTDSISGQIAKATGATVHNCGFGGCRMSKHTGYWDAFSMYNIVDAIISKDFSSQERGANASDTSCPSYFKQTVELLKTIDFNKVDYVTIGYGTNDYTASKNLDVGKGDKNIDAYAGALRYSIEKLLTNFPHIKLLICTPIWRWWEAEEGITSDEKEYGGYTLLDYRDKVIEVCKEYHVSYLNGYDNVGINEFTKRYYFTSPDGTHPNALGNKRYAETIVGRLEQM